MENDSLRNRLMSMKGLAWFSARHRPSAPDPMQTAGARDQTITAVQQLFVLNSSFMHDAATQVASAVATEADDRARLGKLFRTILGREPAPAELDRALVFLQDGSLEQYAQALLSSNEMIFWP